MLKTYCRCLFRAAFGYFLNLLYVSYVFYPLLLFLFNPTITQSTLNRLCFWKCAAHIKLPCLLFFWSKISHNEMAFALALAKYKILLSISQLHNWISIIMAIHRHRHSFFFLNCRIIKDFLSLYEETQWKYSLADVSGLQIRLIRAMLSCWGTVFKCSSSHHAKILWRSWFWLHRLESCAPVKGAAVRRHSVDTICTMWWRAENHFHYQLPCKLQFFSAGFIKSHQTQLELTDKLL